MVAVDGRPKIPGMANKRGRPYRREKKSTAPAVEVTNFIREWREEAEWSQELLSEKSGVSVASISAYERGETDPSIEYLEKLSKALGVPRGMLLDVDPTADPPLWASVMKATAVIGKAKK